MTDRDPSGRMKDMVEGMLLERLEAIEREEAPLDMKLLAEVRQWIKAFPPEGSQDKNELPKDEDPTAMLKKYRNQLPEG